ncbi:Yip1 family protein [Methanoregula sp.]|uniref:Yip1 family protein n=1 Tax=Methanoregula sp. TaxID=2052170 RepID=UPI002C172554|nr:Yip1 family protein [Methanoregula sp.]HVP95760.1 Yip1 family protein [Methanoregula sp.]
MGIKLADLMINPGRFFQQSLGEKEELKVPGLIILAGALAAAVSGYCAGSLSARMMDPVLQGMGPVIVAITVVATFFGTFVAWVVWAGVFFLISKIFGGTGSFSRCLEAVGYGFVPQVIGMVITVAAALVYLPKVTIPALTSAAAGDPQMVRDATVALMHDPAMVTFTEIAVLVSIVFLLWSATIWIFGIKQARGLSLKNAAICVSIPVILYVIFQAYNLAGV